MTGRRLGRVAGERGSMALELVVLVPVLVLVVWLFGVYALRLAVANGDIEAAARDAARSASIARSASGARAAAAASAATSLAGSGRLCRSLRVAAGTADFRPGGTVSVTVTCAIRLADLAPLALGGAKEVRQTYVAPVDPYLGVRT
jgi:Flp pilus assembly protein TadG